MLQEYTLSLTYACAPPSSTRHQWRKTAAVSCSYARSVLSPLHTVIPGHGRLKSSYALRSSLGVSDEVSGSPCYLSVRHESTGAKGRVLISVCLVSPIK